MCCNADAKYRRHSTNTGGFISSTKRPTSSTIGKSKEANLSEGGDMRRHWALLGSGVFLWIVLPSTAQAQSEQQIQWCISAGSTADQTIEGCSGIINSAGQPAANLTMAHYNRGNGYRENQDDDRAIADYSEAIRIDPNYEHAYYNRGITYDHKGDYDRAIDDYSDAIRLDPNDKSPYVNRGIDYRRKHDYDRAAADYSAAIRIDPNNPDVYTNRGVTYLASGKFDKAIADFDLALKFDPNRANSLYGRGMARLKSGDSAGGQSDIAAATAIQSDIAEIFAGIGNQP